MKPLTFAALRLLSDGEFHSGEKLAKQLGVSRATIWQALRPLDEIGVALHKVRGRGYRLPDVIDWLDAALIRERLEDRGSGLDLRIVDSVDSTNSQLLRQLHAVRATSGSAHRAVLAAEWQSGGRGRYDRQWQASPGQALMFSLAWRFEAGADHLSGLSLAIGVGLIRALHAIGVDDAKLKWPNDVLRDRRKLAGILIELSGDALGPGTAIIGIGVNYRLPDKMMSRIDQPAAEMVGAGFCGASRNVVFARILKELIGVLETFARYGFAAFREEWRRYHAFENQNVRVQLPDGTVESGIAIGVTAFGALRLQTLVGEKHFHSGELVPLSRPAPTGFRLRRCSAGVKNR